MAIECPSWCTHRHHPYELAARGHLAMLGRVEGPGGWLDVHVMQMDTLDQRTGRWIPDPAYICVAYTHTSRTLPHRLEDLDAKQAAELAEVLETLGRHELAGYLRQGVAVLTQHGAETRQLAGATR